MESVLSLELELLLEFWLLFSLILPVLVLEPVLLLYESEVPPWFMSLLRAQPATIKPASMASAIIFVIVFSFPWRLTNYLPSKFLCSGAPLNTGFP